MPDWSRRRALQAVGTVTAVALAGCTGGGDTADPPTRRHGDPVTDYDLLQVRDPDATQLFWRGDRETADGRVGGGYEYVDSESTLDGLSFASDSDAAADLSAFAFATDFDERSVLLLARQVAECYEAEFRGVWRDDDGLETAFCQQLRPADESCSREGEDAFGVALRVPFADAEFTSFGSHWSGDCGPKPVGIDEGRNAGGGGGRDA